MAKASKRAKKEPEELEDDDPIVDFDEPEDDGGLDGLPAIAAEDLVERVKLPQRPGTSVSFDIGCEWLNKVCNEEHRKQLDVYVYRTWPIIMRELDPRNINTSTGECPKHIDVVSLAYGKMDRAYMVATHGGGKYKLLVNDISRSEKSHSYTIFTMSLDIPTDEADPKVNLKELVKEDLKNRSFVTSLINRGIMNRDGDVLTDAKKGNTEDSVLGDVVRSLMQQVQSMNERQLAGLQRSMPDDAAMQKAIDLAAKGGERSLEFMIAMAKEKKDPLEMLVPLLTLVTNAQKSNTDGLSTKDVLVMMQTQQAQQAEMFKLMLDLERDKREDKEEKQSISSLIKDIQAIQSLGGSISGNTPWWQGVAESLGPVLSQGLGLVNTIVAARAGVKPPSNPVPQKPVATKYPLPAKITKEDNPAESQTEQPPEAQHVMQIPEGIDQSQYQVAVLAIQQYGGFLLNALQKEQTGDVFASIVADLTSLAQVENIQQIGVETLLNTMKSFPEYWQQVMAISNERAVTRFLTEFCSFVPEPEQAEE